MTSCPLLGFAGASLMYIVMAVYPVKTGRRDGQASSSWKHHSPGSIQVPPTTVYARSRRRYVCLPHATAYLSIATEIQRPSSCESDRFSAEEARQNYQCMQQKDEERELGELLNVASRSLKITCTTIWSSFTTKKPGKIVDGAAIRRRIL